MVEVVKKLALKASATLVKYEVRRHAQKSPREAFKASWDGLLSRRLYRLLVKIGQTPRKESTQLKGRTFEFLATRIPDVHRSERIKVSADLESAIESRLPLLAVHMHDGLRFLSRAFTERKREMTRIVPDPEGHIRWLSGLGIDASRVHAIKDDVLSLAHLRAAIRKNHILCCAIDYRNAKGRRAYINPAIFAFANHYKIPVYFVKAHVNADGGAELLSDGPHLNVDPVTCARNFLEFFNSVGESRASMKIKRYGEHRDWDRKTENRSLLPFD